MTRARRRLLGLVAGLVAAYVLLWVLRPFDERELRVAIDVLGPLAVPAYIAVAVLLGVALIPGSVLSTLAGLLFGPALGVAAAIAAAIGSALLARALSRRVGREGIAELPSPRLRRLEALLERRGVYAVVVQRLLPWVPDGGVSHAAGLLRVRARDLALGTLIGSLPRAVSYAVLGDALAGRDVGQAALGAALLVLTGALGLALGAREWRRARRGGGVTVPSPPG